MIAKVIVDINVRQANKEYDYLIPDDIIGKLSIGDKVIVPFGKNNKQKSAYVIDIIDTNYNVEFELKYIISLQNKEISIEKNMIDVAKFIQNTYGCSMSQALNTVLPVKKKMKTKSDEGLINNIIENKICNLTLEQKNALDSILNDDKCNEFLIHGVTGSGKTQIFIELAKNIIEDNKQVIILVPEIALTYQMVERFIENFGNRVGIINSRLNDTERYEYIKKVLDDEVDIIIGPRSALFAPFKNLGAIIIDEEHELSYKSEKMPRYDAREVAEYICKRDNIKLIYASATPSLDTYYKAINGSIKLIELNKRINNIQLPEISIVDMREEFAYGNNDIFSKTLLDEMSKTLDNGEQVLLFVNRRGYSNYVTCLNCGEPIICKNCDVTYTYHEQGNKLKCHYCDREIPMITSCPNCNSKNLYKTGYGTQRVEQRLKQHFSDYNILRMDYDTTRTKYAYKEILKEFHNHNAQILVGTQMIIKGHDFDNVGLVGILQIDETLNMQSYRASEYTFQTIVQCTGRAGRKTGKGRAIIQTLQPEHYSIKYAAKNDYKSFFNLEIAYRKLMQYPPIEKMLKITIADKKENKVNYVINRIKHYVESAKKDGMVILGPSNEIIYKLNNIFRKSLYIKGNDKIINYFIRVCEYVRVNDSECKYITITYDINPS